MDLLVGQLWCQKWPVESLEVVDHPRCVFEEQAGLAKAGALPTRSTVI